MYWPIDPRKAGAKRENAPATGICAAHHGGRRRCSGPGTQVLIRDGPREEIVFCEIYLRCFIFRAMEACLSLELHAGGLDHLVPALDLLAHVSCGRLRGSADRLAGPFGEV